MMMIFFSDRRCPNCKVPREASKQLSFWRLPSILVIQLKRFKTHSSIYNHEKINRMIKYPFELNLEKYYTANHNDNNNDDDAQTQQQQQQQQSQPSIYDLYAVVSHQGCASWGHYTAFARSSHTNEFGMFFFTKKKKSFSNHSPHHSVYFFFYS